MVPIVDLFKSIQGEGQYVGVPSIFIRVSGCNLRCVFKNSICDTPYTSYNPEKSKFTIEDCKQFIDRNDTISHIVLTGGEPLLYRKNQELIDLLKYCKSINKTITVETNGTLLPFDENVVDLYSVSLKLSNSVKNNENESVRINYEVISELVKKNVQLKFVYSDEKIIKEIETIYDALIKYYKINGDYLNKRTMLMPEGTSVESLSKLYLEIVDVCMMKGWSLTDRLHIRVFGNKRNV